MKNVADGLYVYQLIKCSTYIYKMGECKNTRPCHMPKKGFDACVAIKTVAFSKIPMNSIIILETQS